MIIIINLLYIPDKQHESTTTKVTNIHFIPVSEWARNVHGMAVLPVAINFSVNTNTIGEVAQYAI